MSDIPLSSKTESLIRRVNARIPNSVTPATRIEIHPCEWIELANAVAECCPRCKAATSTPTPEGCSFCAPIPPAKTVTVLTAAKITELTTKHPGLGADTFVHERDYNQSENGRIGLQQEIERLRRAGETPVATDCPCCGKPICVHDNADRLRAALRAETKASPCYLCEAGVALSVEKTHHLRPDGVTYLRRCLAVKTGAES